ncbi:MAG TPA: class I SAM-dependent methyltransferase [Polyangiaceae bacterium]|nr:class I SAM-dependent methyltransferase [Polyangiaceae bacterium]
MTGGGAARFFDAIAGRYERSYALPSDESRRRMARVVRELPHPPGRVLDLGVGTGRELTALLDAGYTPTGVDVSAQMLERCARRARPVALVQADFWEPLPFAAGSFDAVVALHGTLAHPPDDAALARLARELARVVRPAGAWIAETPSPAWLARVETLPQSGDRSVRRTGPQTCVYEDHVVGASVEARVASEAQWRQSLGAHWITRIDALGDTEWLVVSTRA